MAANATPTDRPRREHADKPVVNAKTQFVILPANAVAGTAEDLTTDLAALGVNTSGATGILIVNDSAVSLWLRGAAAGAGTGILVPAGSNIYLGWGGPDTGVIFAENAGGVDIAVFYA